MRRTVVGLFKSLSQAERALTEIETSGYANNQISLVVKNIPGLNNSKGDGEEISGVPYNGVLHDFDGFLVQAGGIDLPVVGNVNAGGPLAGALIQRDKSLAESLTYYGVNSKRAAQIENFVNDGYILAVIETNNSKAAEVANLLNGYGAHNVEKWSKTIDKPLKPWN
ncbi:MAG: hypothetical protein ACYC21_06550 [Eubacteriales bacterium]